MHDISEDAVVQTSSVFSTRVFRRMKSMVRVSSRTVFGQKSYIASPGTLEAPPDRLLELPFVVSFRHSRMLWSAAMIAISVSHVSVQGLAPCRWIRLGVETTKGFKEVAFCRWDVHVNAVQSLTGLIFCFLLAHRTNRFIFFKCFCCPESWVLLISQISAWVIPIWNRYVVLGPAGRYDIEWRIFDVVYFMAFVPVAVLFAASDSWKVKRRFKIIWSFGMIVNWGHQWYTTRFDGSEWAASVNELKGVGTKEARLIAIVQCIVCFAKTVVARLIGQEYALLHPVFVDAEAPSENSVVMSESCKSSVVMADDSTLCISSLSRDTTTVSLPIDSKSLISAQPCSHDPSTIATNVAMMVPSATQFERMRFSL